MQHFTHLTKNERDEIERLLKQGRSLRVIARSLGRAPSTVSRELRRHRADYSIEHPRLDPGGVRAAGPRLQCTLDQWADDCLESKRENERLWSLATSAVDEAASTYRAALKTDTVTDEVAFDALVGRAIAAHPEIPDRMWSKAINSTIRRILRIRT